MLIEKHLMCQALNNPRTPSSASIISSVPLMVPTSPVRETIILVFITSIGVVRPDATKPAVQPFNASWYQVSPPVQPTFLL